MGICLEIKDLTKKFDNKIILKNLNLTVMDNEIIAIVGPSGSGKTTLLNIVGLLDELDSGEIFYSGDIAPKINSNKATLCRRNVINYVFQSLALINDETVIKNLELGFHYSKITREEKNARIDDVLKSLEIFNLKNNKIFTLSGGEQQRVAMARAILKPGDLILADEPTGSLDKKLGLIVFNNLLKLAKINNKTIVLVTHDLDIAEKCDRVVDIRRIQQKNNESY